MSDYERRFRAAEIELDEAGIWPSNGVPPYIRAFQKAGLSPVPPHYKPLWRSFLGQCVFFVLLIGCVTFLGTGPEGGTVGETLLRVGAIGVSIAAFMVAYYAYGRRTYALSRWEDL